MLEILAKLAMWLKPFKKVIHLLVVTLVVLIVVQLKQSPSYDLRATNPLAIFSFLACIWLLLLNLLISLFENIPVKKTEKTGIFSRLKSKACRGVYQFIALLFIALTLTIIFLSIRLLRV